MTREFSLTEPHRNGSWCSKYALLPFRRCSIKVGLLGGSFNPPHQGHAYVCKQASMRMGLQLVYCLVSPQNPLKYSPIRGTIEHRLQQTKDLIGKRGGTWRYRATKLEDSLLNCYTSNTISHLVRIHPETQFIWLMGADNLRQMHRWHKWRSIIDKVHVAVIDRSPKLPLIYCKVAALYPRVNITNQSTDAISHPGSWSFFKIRRVDACSTQLRQN